WAFTTASCPKSDTTDGASLRHVNVLQLRIPFHRRHSKVAAETALFEAAKRGFDMDAGVAVDAEDAALDLARHTQRAAQVVRPNRAAQAVGGIVDLAQHLLLVVERPDANDRAEDFLLPYTVAGLHAKQNGRLQIISARVRTPSVARDDAAGTAGFLDELFARLALRGGNERTNLRGLLRRVAHLKLPGRGDESLDECIEHRPLDEHAAARAAILAGIGEDAHGRTAGGLFEIRVREDNVGRLAAQLQRHAFEVRRGQAHEPRANGGRASEGDFADQPMRGERIADGAPLPWHD